MSERVLVSVELAGRVVPAGVLYVDIGRTISSTFTYDADYLALRGAYALDPALSLSSGPSHTRGIPGAFADAAPDRWGRNLIRRRLERERGRNGRTASEVDFLLGVSDRSRQGALRFSREPGGPFLSDEGNTPRLIEMPQLLRAADQFARSEGSEQDVAALLDAGSGSLGGARPKASILDRGVLFIAKFPHHQDDWDVMAWEGAALDLARAAGMDAAEHRLVRLDEGAVLLVKRFDRRGERRVGYLSAMALLQASDGQSLDYLDIAEELASVSEQPADDLRQLWTRIAFSIAINNTDDHLRNHGLIRGSVGWRLAPGFDLNPNPAQVARQTSVAGFTDREGCARALIESADSFGLDRPAVGQIVTRVAEAVRNWRKAAAANGVSAAQAEQMEAAFNTEVLKSV